MTSYPTEGRPMTHLQATVHLYAGTAAVEHTERADARGTAEMDRWAFARLTDPEVQNVHVTRTDRVAGYSKGANR